MKPSTTPQLGEQPGLRGEYEAALLAQSSKQFYTPSPILLALDHMLVKPKRIAKVLGIARPSVSMMLVGRRPCPQKYEEKLLILLREAVRIGKQTCNDAESGEFKWGDRDFPASAIAFMRQRIDEAEAELKLHEAKKAQ